MFIAANKYTDLSLRQERHVTLTRKYIALRRSATVKRQKSYKHRAPPERWSLNVDLFGGPDKATAFRARRLRAIWDLGRLMCREITVLCVQPVIHNSHVQHGGFCERVRRAT